MMRSRISVEAERDLTIKEGPVVVDPIGSQFDRGAVSLVSGDGDTIILTGILDDLETTLCRAVACVAALRATAAEQRELAHISSAVPA